MPLNYSQIFQRLGRAVFFVRYWIAQQYSAILAPTTGEIDSVMNLFTGGDQTLIPNFASTLTAEAQQMQSFAQVPKTQIADVVFGSLQSALNAPSSSTSVIIPLLAAQMVVDSQTVQESIISTPVVTPAIANVGNGLLKCSLVNPFGVTDQRVISESVSLVCTQSQYIGGTAGAEQFSMTGQPAISVYAYGPQGNGTGPTLTVASQSNSSILISNGDFENWTGSAPNNWTLDSGAACITKGSSPGAPPHTGTYCLDLAGDGSTTPVELSQDLPSTIAADTVYAVGVWLRKAGAVGAGSTLTISVKGTGATTQTIYSADPATLTTSYTLYWLFYSTAGTVGNSIPSDYRISIAWTGANLAGASAQILIDDVVFIAPTNFGNVQYALFRGSADPIVGDQYGVETAVYSGGEFQSFFAEFYDQQLPSSNSPTIPDSYCS